MQQLLSTRTIDALGRLVLPQEARQALELVEQDKLDVLLDMEAGQIILQKNESSPACLCCKSTQRLRELPEGKHLCQKCLEFVRSCP